MRRFTPRRPTPAMGVAFVALLVALSGTAVALPGVGSVDSGDIKNNAVRSGDIRNNNVRSGDVRNGNLTGTDVRNDSLTGLDIDESTLGQVPSANSANTANFANTANSANTANTANSVAGSTFARINYRADTGAGASQILSLNGLTLTASCLGGLLAVEASTAVDNAMMHWAVNQIDSPIDDDDDVGGPNTSEDDFSLYDEDDDLDVGDAELVADNNGTTSAAADSTQGTLTYARPDGGIVTVTFLTEEDTDALGGNADCFVIGHAQSS